MPPAGWASAQDIIGDGRLLKRKGVRCGTGDLIRAGDEVTLIHEAFIPGRSFQKRESTVKLGQDIPGLPPDNCLKAALQTMRVGEDAVFWIDASFACDAAVELPWTENGFEWIEEGYEWEVTLIHRSTGKLDLTSSVKLRSGYAPPLPRIGFGLYMVHPMEAYRVAREGLSVGYRLVDTASMYQNEGAVGQALRDVNLPRSDVFIVSKVNNPDHGYHEALRACERGRSELGVDAIDLYLIHSPIGGRNLETWDALIEARRRGWVRSIGVSNFGIEHIKQLVAAGRELPSVNQIECSPFCQSRQLRDFCEHHGIAVMAYSPLTRGERLSNPQVVAVGRKYGKSAAQVLVRWCLQQGLVAIPKSTQRARLIENQDVFDFTLDAQDMATLGALEENLHTCWDCLNVPWEG